MTRLFLTVGLLAALLALWGCRPDDHPGDGEPSVADLWFRYHFIGTQAVGQDSHGMQVKQVAGMEPTVALVRHVLDRLARSPGLFSGGGLTATQVEQGAALLRPLLDDLLVHESFLEVRGPSQRQPEWLLGVALPAERATDWNAGLSRLRELWELGEWDADSAVETVDAKGFGIRRSGSPGLVRWAEAGGWWFLGIGDGKLTLLDRALAGLRGARRPVAPLTVGWLTAEVDLPRVAAPLGLPSGMIWPRTELTVAGRDENLRTTMRLLFSEPVTGPLRAWQVPTNIACEPLVSFTAMRGVAPMLGRWDRLQSVELEPAPNELYFWAQEHTPFTTFGAFPAADPTNRIKRVAELAPGLLGETWRKRGLTQIEWEPASQQAIWKGLLMVTPHLRGARDAGTNFIVGGLFPQLRTPRPPPADLLAQFVSRPDVIYYDWEITQARLGQWRHLSQLFSVIAGHGQLTADMTGLKWLLLLETEPLLGNTITEITAVSPKEWSLTRRSHIGFNGLELVSLARWIESPEFPRLSLRLPETAARKPVPAALPPAP